MLKIIIFSSLFISSTLIYAAPSVIPSDFHGDWDISQKICTDVNKQIVDSDTRIEISAKQIMSYREICKVSSVSKSSATLINGFFSCESNDGDSNTKRNFNLSLGADNHLVWNKANYVKCADLSKTLGQKVSTSMALCTYTTKISDADKKNSSGVPFPLTNNKATVAAIIRQDRANYHQFNIRDKEDQTDCVFADKTKRALIEKSIADAPISPELIPMIVEQHPVLSITIFESGKLGISKK